MIAKSRRQLAVFLGLSHQRLKKREDRGDFAPEPGGGYDVEGVRRALRSAADVAQPSQAGGVEVGNPPHGSRERERFNCARARREEANARQAELDLKVREGELVNGADVAKEWGEMIGAARAAALLLPDKLASRVASVSDVRECQVILAAEIAKFLTELSEYRAADEVAGA